MSAPPPVRMSSDSFVLYCSSSTPDGSSVTVAWTPASAIRLVNSGIT